MEQNKNYPNPDDAARMGCWETDPFLGRDTERQRPIFETERLMFRKFTNDDFEAVHSYASVFENVKYMQWGPNDEAQTREFINRAIAYAEAVPCRNYQFAAILKQTGRLIGGCNLALSGEEEGEVGWILHRDYWKQGLGTEMGAFLLRFGFEDQKLHRILAHCDAENYGSYRVMERNGMRREGCFIEGWPANKISGKKYADEYSYALLAEEWETRKEIAYYNSLPVIFEGFIEVPRLADGDIELVCVEKRPADPEKKFVPAYQFDIHKNGVCTGHINLRIGYTDGLYYGGQIGYGVDEAYRGHGYAGKACRLLIPVLKAHGMTTVLITNHVQNAASKRVCEKLGARLVRVARLPAWHHCYEEGHRFMNIFEWDIK